MRILIATDAWEPQVNGVVRTLKEVTRRLQSDGDVVHVLSADGRRTIGLPSYSEIRLSMPGPRAIAREIDTFEPDAVHIATEGPIGWRVRRYCLTRKLPFTTSYHSRFPEYVSARVPVPGVERAVYTLLRRFHGSASSVLVPTPAVAKDLSERGFENLQVWTRGVDHKTFRPEQAIRYDGTPPFLLHCGRLAKEKNVRAFLELDIPGTKIVIGDGPERASLERRFPQARFLGYLFGNDLAAHLAGGDVFVFPSFTDTFGLVMIEANACGLPVAAFPVTGPVDVIAQGESGWLDEDLSVAVTRALTLPRQQAIDRAASFTWEETASQFRRALSVL